jgi:hypothetical protein
MGRKLRKRAIIIKTFFLFFLKISIFIVIKQIPFVKLDSKSGLKY